jgi:hypothetical protein
VVTREPVNGVLEIFGRMAKLKAVRALCEWGHQCPVVTWLERNRIQVPFVAYA